MRSSKITLEGAGLGIGNDRFEERNRIRCRRVRGFGKCGESREY